MNRKIFAVPGLALAAGLALSACGPSSSHAASEQSAKAKASALAKSSAGQKARTDAQTLLKQCPVPQGASQLSKSHWEAWVSCADVPKANWKPAAGCILTAVEHGGKLPADQSARETALINDAFPCVEKYHGASK